MNRRRATVFAVAAGVVALGLALTGTPAGAQGEPRTPLEIRLIHGTPLSMIIASMPAKKDILPNYGKEYTLSLRNINSSAEVATALAAGAGDIGTTSAGAVISVNTKLKADLRVVADQIQNGMMDFGVVIAAPSAMAVVGKLGKVLGPRGLMPNPKVGTVTKDVKQAVENAKGGQVQFRTDKNGIIHCAIGKISFSPEAIIENFNALLTDVNKARPSSSKGIFLKKISLSTTMGPGVLVDQGSLTV